MMDYDLDNLMNDREIHIKARAIRRALNTRNCNEI